MKKTSGAKYRAVRMDERTQRDGSMMTAMKAVDVVQWAGAKERDMDRRWSGNHHWRQIDCVSGEVTRSSPMAAGSPCNGHERIS